MTHLILVRHGETNWNKILRFQGWAETSLNEVGQRQTELLAERLRSEVPSALYTSDLGRALDTARGIGTFHQCAVVSLSELREMSFGRWEGMTFEEVSKADESLTKAWVEDPIRNAPPDGETLLQVVERVDAAIARIQTDVPEGTVIVVTHGGPIRVLLCQRLGLPLSCHWQYQISPASITTLELHPAGAILCGLNDTNHL